MGAKKQFKWSSHNPVVMGCLDRLQPKLVVELGVGNYSSPLFFRSNAQKIIHVENDREWLEHVRRTHAPSPVSEFRHHDLGPNVANSTHVRRIPDEMKEQARAYYDDLANTVNVIALSPRLLFVDHFACMRTIAINRLARHFDIVIYHDAEAPTEYEYDQIDDMSDIFDRHMLHTPSSWTGFFSRKDRVDPALLQQAVMDQAEKFGQIFNLSRKDFSVESL